MPYIRVQIFNCQVDWKAGLYSPACTRAWLLSNFQPMHMCNPLCRAIAIMSCNCVHSWMSSCIAWNKITKNVGFTKRLTRPFRQITWAVRIRNTVNIVAYNESTLNRHIAPPAHRQPITSFLLCQSHHNRACLILQFPPLLDVLLVAAAVLDNAHDITSTVIAAYFFVLRRDLHPGH